MFGWDDARFFLEIHRAGSLSAAVRGLRVNQSTVGRRLAALESVLGVRLFDRTPGGYLLTPAGETLLPRAERMEEEALAAARDVAGGEARLAGTVRLTAPETFGSRFLTSRLADFHQRYRTGPAAVLPRRPGARARPGASRLQGRGAWLVARPPP